MSSHRAHLIIDARKLHVEREIHLSILDGFWCSTSTPPSNDTLPNVKFRQRLLTRSSNNGLLDSVKSL